MATKEQRNEEEYPSKRKAKEQSDNDERETDDVNPEHDSDIIPCDSHEEISD